MKQYAKLANALSNNIPLERGPKAPDFTSETVSFIGKVLYDSPHPGHSFGDCIQQPPHVAYLGDTVRAKFVSNLISMKLVKQKEISKCLVIFIETIVLLNYLLVTQHNKQ